MLIVTPSISSDRAKRYFSESLKRDDYYIDGQEIAGEWFGKGAERLGLKGQVDQESYFALCDNRNPDTGEQLTPRQKTNRRPMYDWTFSAPKLVSVVYELSGDERILDAFHKSVRETMDEAEAEMKTRVRKGGKDEDRVTGNLVAAEFTHFTARPVEGQIDPHLHSHVVVFNTTFDTVENRWKASQQGDLKRDADYWEAAFDARFAKRLNDMGYATVKDGTSFTLAGLPKSITDEFSQRRNDIEKKAAARGIVTDKGKHLLGASIREAKQKDVTKGTLRKQWDARLTPDQRASLRAVVGGKNAGGDRDITAKEAVEYSLDHSFERASVVSEKRLRAEALRYAVGSIRPEDVADLARHREAISVKHQGQVMLTTKKVLNDEVAMLQFARDGQRKFAPFVSELDTGALEGLSEDQKRAARQILGSRDTVTGVAGKAGTGKTRMMRATIAALESGSGQRVFVFAPSSQASRGVLKTEGFTNAETLAMLLKSEKLQEQTNGQVLWIDEAGMISSKDMKRLFEVAKKGGNRVILSGDYVQHSSVEAGDAFRLLEKEAGVKLARLTKIMRQEKEADRRAIDAFSEGTEAGTKKGYDLLVKGGRIIEIADDDELRKSLADAFTRLRDAGETPLVITPTHARAKLITEELRARLKERGELGEEHEFMGRRALGWTSPQKGDARNYQPGMVVEFHQNATGFTRGDRAVVVADEGEGGLKLLKENGDRKDIPLRHGDRFEVYRILSQNIAARDQIRITKNGQLKVEGQARGTPVNNGDVYPVEGFTKEGDIRLPGGKVMPRDFGHFTLGYVSTSQGSQGKTRHHELVDWSSSTLVATDRKAAYVTPSRFVKSMQAFVNDKKEAREHLARGGDRLSAVELTRTKVRQSTWRERFAKSFERLRVTRFLKERANAITNRWRGKEGMSYG